MLLEIRSNTGEVKIVAAPSDNDRETAGIQQDSALSLSFTAFECVALDVYDYVDFLGRRYILTEAYMPQMNARGEWAYSVKFSGVEALAAQTLMVNPTDGTDNPVVTLTAPAAEHAALIVANLNRRTGSSDWQVGEVIETPYLDIDYTGKNAAEAVAALAKAAGTEWWFDAMTLNICRCEFGEPIELEYGGILLGGIKRGVADGADFFTRLFPIGSSRNIDVDKYGHARLQLPDGSAYVDSRTELGIIERFEEDAFAGIYPRRIGTVGAVRSETRTGDDGVDYTVWFFTDPDLPFNPNDYEIGGLVKNVTFQTGELRGRVFEVNYDTRSGEFEIITQWPYDNGVQLPTPPMIPASGDEYILWNISMPESYYPAAEQEYAEAVAAFIADRQKDVSVFTAPTDYTVATPVAGQLRPGRRVRIKSEEYFPETGWHETRIISVSRSVANVGSMTLTMSDVLSSGRIQAIESGLNEVRGATSKISSSLSSKNESLARKLDKSAFYDLFEKVNIGTAAEPKYAIHAKYGLYTDSFLSALGLNPGTGDGEGGGATALYELNDVQLSGLLTGDVLIYDGTHWVNRPQSSIVPNLSEYATRTWVQQQGYATSAALAAHAGNTTLHVTSSERTLWNKTAADLSTILGADSDQIINKWEEVVAFLDTYTEADTLANLLSNKVDKTTRVVAGTGLTGGGALAGNVTLSLASRTLWGQPFNGEADIEKPAKMQYILFKAVDGTDAGYIGRGASSSDDIYINSYKGLNILFQTDGNVGIGTTAPAYKLDVAGEARLQNRLYFGDSAHYIEVDDNGYFHFSHGVYSDSFLSALGLNSSGGGGEGGGSYDRLDAWGDYTADKAGWVLSAALGYDLHSRVSSLESNIVPDLSEYATRTWVQQQGYATSAALAAHAGDTTLHVTSSERTLWNRTAADFAAIVGADSDDIINKWEEVVAFLDTYTEADTLANLLSNKVDKTTRVIAGTGLTGGGALAGNVTLSLASRTLWGQPFDGSGNVSGDMTDVGSITANDFIRAKTAYYLYNSDDTYRLTASISGNASIARLYMIRHTDSVYGDLYLGHSGGTAICIKDGTNVGIGTTAPAYKLDVAGEARLQNRLYFGDSTHYIELDENGDFHFSHGVYSDSFLSALGLNSSGGGGEGGATYDRLDAWADYTAERAGWVLSAALGYDLHSRVSSLEGDSALSFTTEGTGNVVTAVKKSGTAVIVTKGLTALTAHQPIYSLAFQAGAFEAKTYYPNTGTQTVNIPTKVSHLSNDSGFITAAALTGYATQSWVQGLGYITASALTPYITTATAEATFATKLGILGNQIGTYVGGKLGNLITVPYAANAASLATARTLWGQTFDGSNDVDSPAKMQYLFFTAIDGTNAGYIGRGSSTTDAIYISSYKAQNILFTTDGNIGIGTKAPAYKCHVAGSMYVDGTTTLAGNLSVSGAITGAGTITAAGIVSAQGYKGNYINIECTDAGAPAGQQINGRNNATIHIQYQTGNVTLCAKGGMVGIGLNSPSYSLDVNGVVHSNGGIFSDGYVSAKGQNTASDARLKRRIADVALTVRDVAEAPVYRFAWINGGGIDVGSTAQYWAARVPELTHLLADGIHLGLDYGKAALLSVVSVARATADHERRIADIERQLQNRTI